MLHKGTNLRHREMIISNDIHTVMKRKEFRTKYFINKYDELIYAHQTAPHAQCNNHSNL